MTLSIHLTRDLEQFARACVDTGRYDSMSAVVREGLKLLREVEDRRRSVIEAAAGAVQGAEEPVEERVEDGAVGAEPPDAVPDADPRDPF